MSILMSPTLPEMDFWVRPGTDSYYIFLFFE